MLDQLELVIRSFIADHQTWAGPIVFILSFGESLAFISLLLPFYLTLLGFSALEVGILITVTLFGAGATTLVAGLIAHRYRSRSLLVAGSLLLIVAVPPATSMPITLS